MFERYTEKARQVVFHARYYAAVAGSPYIETNHLLLGLLRSDHDLQSLLGDVESLRTHLETPPAANRASATADLPLSFACKNVLAYAAEESERLRHRSISTLHLLAGLLRCGPDDPAHTALAGRTTLEHVRARLEAMPEPDHRPDDKARSERDPIAAIPPERQGATQEILLALATEEDLAITVRTRDGERQYRFP